MSESGSGASWANIAFAIVILAMLTVGGCVHRALNKPNGIHFNVGG